MARLNTAVSAFPVILWLCLFAVRPAAAQQTVEVTDDPIRIADFGLEAQVTSAIDLVGPQDGAAGRYRAALAERLTCWIDGTERCSVADRNDPRVRAMRRFLGVGPRDRDGAITVVFPDDSSVEVKLERIDVDPDDWDERVYQAVVLPDTARAPGLPSIPSRSDQVDGLAHESSPEIQAALERLKARLEAPLPSGQATPSPDVDDAPRALVQRPPG
jgi:hypothetical protein